MRFDHATGQFTAVDATGNTYLIDTIDTFEQTQVVGDQQPLPVQVKRRFETTVRTRGGGSIRRCAVDWIRKGHLEIVDTSRSANITVTSNDPLADTYDNWLGPGKNKP